MDVTLLGHASLVIRGGDRTVLMDPVFEDPFEFDTVSCPKRVVHVEALPRPDAVVLSHGHTDHFDVKSLSRLSRTVDIYLPPDERMTYTLRGLQFTKLHHVSAWDEVRFGNLEYTPTPSGNPWEFGALFRDSTGSVWNQVDSIVTQATCVTLLERLGGMLDAVLCGFQPLLVQGETWVSETDFPTERYERLLEMALCSRARAVIPGSAGQRMMGDRAWLNHRVYPVSREKFLADITALAPEVSALMLNPGETLRIGTGSPPCVVSPEGPAWAETVADDTGLTRFAPSESPPPEVTDPNILGYPADGLREVVTALVERQLLAKMRTLQVPQTRGVFRTLWDRRAVVQIECVTPEETMRWHVSTWSPEVTLVQGAHPDPDYTYTFVASELAAYMDEERAEYPSLRASRRRATASHARGDSQRFRMSTLEPARLEGHDPYFIMDRDFMWNPLVLLTDIPYE